MYKIDFNILFRLLLPTFLRKSRLMALLRSCIIPVQWLHNGFMRARDNNLFRESIDSSIPRLEFMLNSIFYPPGLTTDYNYRIIISHLPAQTATAIFLGGITQPIDEGQPKYIHLDTDNKPLYIYTDGEAGQISFDFIVMVPQAVAFDLPRMHSLIRSYCLPDKDFDIITY